MSTCRNWCWPPARSETMVHLQSQLPLVPIGEKDQPIWFVWFNLAIPKHSFFLWLAMRDSLVTGEKMLRWGYGGDVNCVFCRGY
jgi:hypothetical protein